MSSHKHRRRKRAHTSHVSAPGTSPGTLVADPNAKRPEIHLIGYGPNDFHEHRVHDPAAVREHLGRFPVLWIDVEGLGDLDTIRTLGEMFGLHPLAMEDVLNAYQRPKVEQYGEHYFIVARMTARTEHLETEQLSIFLGANFVLTFQDSRPGDCLEPVRQRIRSGLGRIRQTGPDYLTYRLLDAVVDSNFPVLEQYGEMLDELEDVVLDRPSPKAVARMHAIKRDLLVLRRATWPLRDALHVLLRDPIPVIQEETKLYLRDCHDHALRIVELIETYRELTADLVDLYLSSVNNRMSEVMKVLTVFSAVFIPLTFIVGVYGMNFNTKHPLNMPELESPYGYVSVWGFMATVAFALLIYFWRKGWLAPLNPKNVGPPSQRDPDPFDK